MQEFVDFLGKQAPYDRLEDEDLERLAAHVEVEYFPADAIIIEPGRPRLDRLAVIRTGLVEVLDHGRVVDELGPGDTFGHLSVLSGLPPTLTVRAAADTLVYLLPDPRTLLEHPEQLTFRTYGAGPRPLLSGAADYGLRPVTEFMREPLWCAPDTTIREAATAMTDGRQSCVLIRLPGDQVGIMTDSDCRRRVATGEVPVDAPVAVIASSPVHTIDSGEPAAMAFLQMLQRGVHHLAVVNDHGDPVGVCRVVDLTSADVRDPLAVRATIDAADSVADLALAAGAIRPAVVELFDAGVPPLRVGGLMSVLIEAVVEKCVGWVAPFDAGTGEFAWLFLGSLARREPLPVSDVDTAMVWRSEEYAGTPEALHEAAGRVLTLIERCGLERCPDGANADNPLFNRGFEVWVAAARKWEQDADGPGSLLLSSMLADSRPITGLKLGRKLQKKVRKVPESPQFRRRMLQEALVRRPPLGFVRDFVVESDGEHKGELDLKRRGLGPVVALSRWLAICTATPIAPTQERLAAGAAAGLLTIDECEQLQRAHEQMYELIFEAEVEALRAGRVPSTYVDPRELDTLTRRHLRESFKAIDRVQERLEGQWVSRLR